jgi:histidinol dehydrogenase
MTSAAVMRRLRWTDLDEAARRRLFDRGLADVVDSALQASIAELVDDVRIRGDMAICDATARFDGIALAPEQLRVSDDDLDAARVSPELDEALDDAIAHLRAFNEHLRDRASDWQLTLEPGLVAGEKITPIASAGLFVPSGKASYPSVAYQLGVPAVVAGVPEIVVVVPPVPGGRGEVDPAVLVVCRKLGLRTVIRGNGPACIAGVGFGTDTLPRVRKIVGPGSPAVTMAQVEMQRHGVVTMMVLGPTESLVIADDTADPERLASDLLIEAEHGTDSSVWLVTTSHRVADAVDAALGRQLHDLPPVRAEAARAALGVNGGCVVVRDLDTAVDVANRYAPEHLQVAVAPEREDAVVDAIVDAGEILVGQHTPFSAANFVIGCPASLPTSGFAKVSSGITVEAFLKRTAVARCDAQALARLTPSILALSDHEGFPAHGAALRRRFP